MAAAGETAENEVTRTFQAVLTREPARREEHEVSSPCKIMADPHRLATSQLVECSLGRSFNARIASRPIRCATVVAERSVHVHV
ncbi:uncharacterized protein LAESUDRAFT_728500 [Laetiporus sulphureus 93-53]|uniref:Uncharacterized protein n=1 Tax=Laetiporus sulphureus 93-53 TaxID=1314785 RepID=A0A165D2F4_9APHY|nr:uncharacterized protein LAESUDRAFT_728500 [Laetiporus sulphureus 93-53]KZT04019.1 hypothetical protein LAESUDRAFT_728500 [Laetiporus sulphureus 93-53]